ncbi:uncharacterized protein LOC106169083 isoform X2 [Lingula anatina]|uniref:Uncharacterized protein LOC106169083 isoform X2 n=1 Tax=Lingula anatina TaxID=7574 RepID=A0A1S3J0U0_LINAN|nr:uncharacterized protein LOC106169083 isoform X2 [Lingula anatina]XP_013403878.1 uncharacterized protein LOC106169083 isoform X2 [Lingula anatina]XP_013403879.1 uncharacterized protein LOC106169083 isoform X2 [Lingula anatina]|eukprot:XP_013403877.1 uncharacterized protein LOC106169083 isoform X2 [Lingula anatina]
MASFLYLIYLPVKASEDEVDHRGGPDLHDHVSKSESEPAFTKPFHAVKERTEDELDTACDENTPLMSLTSKGNSVSFNICDDGESSSLTAPEFVHDSKNDSLEKVGPSVREPDVGSFVSPDLDKAKTSDISPMGREVQQTKEDPSIQPATEVPSVGEYSAVTDNAKEDENDAKNKKNLTLDIRLASKPQKREIKSESDVDHVQPEEFNDPDEDVFGHPDSHETLETEQENNLESPTYRQKRLDSQMSTFAEFSGDGKEYLTTLLEELRIRNAVWGLTEDKKLYQVTFVEEGGERCETIMKSLQDVGVGSTIKMSSISAIPISIHLDENAEYSSEESSPERSKEDIEGNFFKSIKSRLTVAQVVEQIKAQAALTFDYVMLIILASIIAGFGLLENSSVILVASMLVSPLMGPILAGTFGLMVQNKNLGLLGIKTELVGLGLCIASGFVLGIIAGVVGPTWGAVPQYPTPEMAVRGQVRSLWSGVLIAVPSGAGVALSVLGGNAGSLVGVAISASLLPPATNAGMLWAYAIVSAANPPAVASESNITSPDSHLQCPPFLDNEYEPVYSCWMASEAIVLGTVSLMLTLLNILCIFLMGIAILKVKEVVPNTAATTATDAFWKKDIKVARDSYKTMKPGEESTNRLAKNFLQEWQNLKKEIKAEDRHRLREMLHHVSDGAEFSEILARAPQNLRAASRTVARQISNHIAEDCQGEGFEDQDSYHHTIHSFMPDVHCRSPISYSPKVNYITVHYPFNWPRVRKQHKKRAARPASHEDYVSGEESSIRGKEERFTVTKVEDPLQELPT